MQITVVHIDECPNWREAGARVERAAGEFGVEDAHVSYVRVSTPDEATAAAFAGSPTVLVDGVDVFAGGALTDELACRVFREGERLVGLPSQEAFVDALRARLGR